MKVWSWRHAVQQSDLKPTVRLVLFNLSIYMNDHGQSCYPTIDQQTKDTGLCNKSIIRSIATAEKAGFLVKKKHGFSGQKWANNEYEATFPNGCELEKGSEPVSKRSCTSVQKVGTQVHTNSPYNSSNKENIKIKIPDF